MRGALVAVVALAGCASGPSARPGGATSETRWLRLVSPHFVVVTNVPASAARPLQADLERGYQLLARIAFPKWTEPKGRVRVIYFEDANDYAAIAPAKTAGFFRAAGYDVVEQPTIVFAAQEGYLTSFVQTREISMHELTHRFIHTAIPQAPPWLHEGLAQYYEMLEEDYSERQVIAGKHLTGVAFMSDWAPLREILGVDAAAFYRLPNRHERYGASWGLVHFFMNQKGERARFDCMLDAMKGGAALTGAWAECIGVQREPQLDAKVRAYFEATPSHGARLPAPPRREAEGWTFENMSESDTLVLMAELRDWDDEKARGLAKAELARAVGLAPAATEARYMWGRLLARENDVAGAAAAFEGVIASRPDDSRYWQALGEVRLQSAARERTVAVDGEKIEEAVTRMLALPCAAESMAFAARVRARFERTDEALALARRAVAEETTCWRCHVTLAELLYAKGEGEPALAELERAIQLLPDGRVPGVLFELRRKWGARK